VYASGNVRALLVDAHQHIAGLEAQALAVNTGEIFFVRVETDFFHHASDDLFVIDLCLSGDLPSNHYHVILGRSLTCHLAFRIACQAGVEDSVGDLVAEFVWVTFVHRLRREQKDALSPRHALRSGLHVP